MPLADPFKPAEDGMRDIDRAALAAVSAAGALPFSAVCAATTLHGDHQATEQALIRLRQAGKVSLNYGTGMITAGRTEVPE